MSDAVLLTGASGFLGMELLVRLLERGERDVIVLLRARDELAAAERLERLLARLYERPPPAAERVRAIGGDLTSPGLGLDAGARRELLARTTSVIHCAASIAFDLPLAEARTVNVGGTSRILALARELSAAGRLRRIVHVSTAYVCGRHHGAFGERRAPRAARFRNSYERSKAEAERLLDERGADLPLAIARPSIVVGDSCCGWTPSFNVVYWPLQAFARGMVEQIPAAPDGSLDIVPVDYAADGILALHDDTTATGAVNLVAGDLAVSNRRLLELASAHFERPAPPFVTDGALASVREAAVYLPYVDVRASFEDHRARELLQPHGIACPPLERYFSTLMGYAQRARWGKLAPTRSSVHGAVAPATAI
jgi:thioester reductase-like protein